MRMLYRSLPQLLSGVLDQQQTQVAQLRQVFLCHSFHQVYLVHEPFLPYALDALAAGRGEAGPYGTAVLGVRHPLDQAVTLEVVDQPRDVARRHGKVVRHLAKRQVAAAEQAEEHAHPPLAETVLRAPTLLEKVQRLAREAQGRQSFDGRDVDIRWSKKLAKPLHVEAPVLVVLDIESDLRELLQFLCIHIEFLH